MRKFIDFAKKQLLIITASVFVAFTAMLIIVSCLPKGSKYEYEFSVMGITMEVDYVFKGDEVTVDTYVFGAHDSETTKYKINKGELYMIDIDNDKWEYVGEINAYEIVMKADAEETGIGDMEIVLECKTNKALRTLAIVFMSVSGVLAVGCVVVYFLDKKGLLKFADKVEPAVVEGTELEIIHGEEAGAENPQPEDVQETTNETEVVEQTGEESVQEDTEKTE